MDSELSSIAIRERAENSTTPETAKMAEEAMSWYQNTVVALLATNFFPEWLKQRDNRFSKCWRGGYKVHTRGGKVHTKLHALESPRHCAWITFPRNPNLMHHEQSLRRHCSPNIRRENWYRKANGHYQGRSHNCMFLHWPKNGPQMNHGLHPAAYHAFYPHCVCWWISLTTTPFVINARK